MFNEDRDTLARHFPALANRALPLNSPPPRDTLIAGIAQASLSQRQLAARLGVKQPVIAKLEAGKSRNIGLQTLVRAVKAMNGHIKVSITTTGRRVHTGRKRNAISRKVAARGKRIP